MSEGLRLQGLFPLVRSLVPANGSVLADDRIMA